MQNQRKVLPTLMQTTLTRWLPIRQALAEKSNSPPTVRAGAAELVGIAMGGCGPTGTTTTRRTSTIYRDQLALDMYDSKNHDLVCEDW